MIKKYSDISFHYVTMTENLVDLASRGKAAAELITDSLWWNDPPWLLTDDSTWPSQANLEKIESSNNEQEILCSLSLLAPEGALAEKIDYAPYNMDLTRYSSLTKLLRITARITRFISQLKRQKIESGNLTTNEINAAKFLWVKSIQKEQLSEIFLALSKNKSHPLINQFDLNTDMNGILRCGRRLENSDLMDFAKHPMLLPKKHHLTKLIIKNFHKKLFHTGVSHTLAQIRQEYWIPSG